MRELIELPLEQLDEIFRSATKAAKEEADHHGLPEVGEDETGRLVKHPGFNFAGARKIVA